MYPNAVQISGLKAALGVVVRLSGLMRLIKIGRTIWKIR
jgi:hypothetical protein